MIMIITMISLLPPWIIGGSLQVRRLPKVSQRPAVLAVESRLGGSLLTLLKEDSEGSRTQVAYESLLRSADSMERRPSANVDEFDAVSEFSFRIAAIDTIDQITTTLPEEASFQSSVVNQKTDSEQVAPAVPQTRLSGVSNEWSAPTLPERKYYFAERPTPSHEGEDFFRSADKNLVEESHPTGTFYGVENSDPLYSQHQNSEKVNRDTGLFHAAESNRQTSSQVIRKINSGFEILRPGTFDRSQPHDDTKLEKDMNAEKKSSRKLQRKSRDVGQSRDSRFVEGT